ncbi:MAG: helix-turn-helix transcriptional regulator [Firmicutes bacterium]|nr:helix-turn-helix transcriptional regulator [Bacillota bacterium]
MRQTTAVSHSLRTRSSRSSDRATQLILLHRPSGLVRCRLPGSGRNPSALMRAASVLALLCHARGENPQDYELFERSSSAVQNRLRGWAAELLRAALPKVSVPLTRREQQVLAGVADELSNKEIATRLRLSERTVKFHISALLKKFRVRSRTALVREAYGVVLAPPRLAFGWAESDGHDKLDGETGFRAPRPVGIVSRHTRDVPAEGVALPAPRILRAASPDKVVASRTQVQ